MLNSVESNGLCWWCGEVSNSREHKVKRTDIKRIYGKGPYQEEKLGIFNIDVNNVRITKTTQKTVQSSDSDHLKFESCLCQKCNNERSAPFDRAYDIFMDYVDSNLTVIKEEDNIDLKKVYGVKFIKQKLNLFRYYAKHICCRIAINGYNIPKNIIRFLNDEEPLKDINFQFQIKHYELQFSEKPDDSLQQLYIGELKFHKKLSNQKIVAVTGWYTYKQFSVNYVVAKNIIPYHFFMSKCFFYKRKIKLEKISYSLFTELVDINNEQPIDVLAKLEEFPYINDYTGELRLNALMNYKM